MLQKWDHLLGIAMHLLLFGLVVLLIVAVILVIMLLIKTIRGGSSVEKHGLLQVHKKSQYEKEEALAARSYRDRKKLKGAPTDGTKPRQEAVKPDESLKPVLAIKFDGDLMASARKNFAELVDEVIANKERIDSAVVVVSSPGGGVSHYGQMFSEMERIRNSGVQLTVCVDTYAASGGYLMSLPAQKIIAAPYAVIGSIGVVAELVNVHDFLKSHGLQPLTLTAGKYKRTVTPLGPVTEEGTQHMLEHLEAIHRLFISSVQKYRKVDPDKVCNGDFWTAQESVDLNLGLVDELGTSQDYLYGLNQTKDLITLSQKKGRFEQGLLKLAINLVDHVLARLLPAEQVY